MCEPLLLEGGEGTLFLVRRSFGAVGFFFEDVPAAGVSFFRPGVAIVSSSVVTVVTVVTVVWVVSG